MLILKGALGKALEKGVLGFLLFLDGIFYQLASWLYRLFYQLASVQLLSNDMYESIANRVYLLVGVISLFVFTFLLLKSLVDPDSLSKGIIKSFKSLVISIILLLLMPTIFTYVYSVQAAFFHDNIIEKFFNFELKADDSGTHDIDNEPNYRKLSMSDYCDNNNPGSYNVGSTTAITESGMVTKNECQANYLFLTVMEAFFEPDDSNVQNEFETSWIAARKYMIYTGKFNYVKSFSEPLVEQDNISYLPIVSSAAAIFLIYVTLSFCIDIGVRAAKLAFYQVIAPIPILMKIIPGKESQYEKWQKSTVNTFLEVFTRIIILNFVMFMCKNIITILNDLANNGNDVGMFGKAILILGLFTFAKQAPKLLQEAIGFEGGNLKLGIKDKLNDAPIIGKPLGSAANFTGNTLKNFATMPGRVGTDLAGRAIGAATGALGAGWASKVNGGGFINAAKLGAINGAGAKGLQFNKQRQNMYGNVMGLKGTSGWFGSQNALERFTEKSNDKFSDYYKDTVIPQRIANIESGSEWQSIYNSKFAELEAENNKIQASYDQQIENKNELRSNLDIERNSALSELGARRASALAEIGAKYTKENMLNELSMKNDQMHTLFAEGSPELTQWQQQYLRELDNIENADAIRDKALADINAQYDEERANAEKMFNDKVKALDAEIAELNQNLSSELKSAEEIEKEARKAAVKKVSDTDLIYEHDTKVKAKREREAELREIKKTTKYASDVEAFTEALKNANFNKKD